MKFADSNAIERTAGAKSSAYARSQVLLSGGLIGGGSLTTVGAILPWLTLYAGLHDYSGTTGPYGWLVFGAGLLALAGGFISIRSSPAWLGWTSICLGSALLIFSLWLFAGLIEIVNRPNMQMLVPRPGVGLYLTTLGAVVIIAGGVSDFFFRHTT